jgi:MoxR-like ATPase
MLAPIGRVFQRPGAADTGCIPELAARIIPMPATPPLPASIDETAARLLALDYVPERALATTVFLALKLQRPLFLEGEPGTGKTEIAKTLAAMLGRPLIRLQCHEGLDLAGAAYEWNYARQMLEIRLAESEGKGRGALADELFSDRFLIRRALLQAIDPAQAVPPVLLIDELDRADEPFEAFLLEVLSDFQITIPEYGTVKAVQPPIVVLTSNRTREIHDAVKRRCLYHWVGFPDARREAEILARRVPGAPAALSAEIVAFVQKLRGLELYKLPGIAETIEWTRALMELDALVLDPETINHTLGVLLKYQDDIARVQGSEAARLLASVKNDAAGPR